MVSIMRRVYQTIGKWLCCSAIEFSDTTRSKTVMECFAGSSQSENHWLPGLVSQSAILRDLSDLTWRRLRHGRITLAPT
jgi:hypothetical protein